MILVDADPGYEPPRNTVRVSVSHPADPDEVIQTITVYRVVDGVRTALRQQPIPGASVIEAYDHEAPYGLECTYEWAGSFLNVNGMIAALDEPWADLDDWTAAGGAGMFSVSAGSLHFTAAGFTPTTLTQTLPAGRYRLSIYGWFPLLPGANATIAIGDVVVDLRNARWRVGSGAWIATGEWGPVSIGENPPLVVEMQPGGVGLYLGTERIGYTTVASALATSVVISAVQDADPAGTRVLGRVVAERFAELEEVSEGSFPVLLAPRNGWLVHPTRPVRSVELDGRGGVDIRSAGAITNASTQTVHEVIGASYPVVVSSGPRRSDAWQLRLATDTAAAEAAVVALLADQSPVLVNIPAASGAQITYGFYAIGDISRERFAQLPGLQMRTVTLPLRLVAPPLGLIVEVQWSYAALAAELGSYADQALAFDSYNALALNRRF